MQHNFFDFDSSVRPLTRVTIHDQTPKGKDQRGGTPKVHAKGSLIRRKQEREKLHGYLLAFPAITTTLSAKTRNQR